MNTSDTLTALQEIIRSRAHECSEDSYTAHLLKGGAALQKRKIGEEAVEVITATAKKEIVAESADLLFHLCVYLEASGLSIDDVYSELRNRMK